MYLHLGKTKIKYQDNVKYDYMICSMVISSNLSYERPIMVRNLNELLCWFGEDFKEYRYCKELIEQGVSLWITKPLSEENNLDGYINYNNFPAIFTEELPDVGNSNKIYGLNYRGSFEWDGQSWISSSESNSSLKNFYVTELPDEEIIDIGIYHLCTGGIWFWLNEIGDWVEESLLPQNAYNPTSISENNRDTLWIWRSGRYYTPSYRIKTEVPYINALDLTKNGNYTLTLTLPDNIPENWNGFIIYDRVRLDLYKDNYVPITDQKLLSYYDNVEIFSDINNVNDVIGAVNNFLLDKISINDKIITKESCIFLSSKVIDRVRFYRLPGFEFKQDYQLNQDYIIKSIENFEEVTIKSEKNISINYDVTSKKLIIDNELYESLILDKFKFYQAIDEKRPDIIYSGDLWSWIILNRHYNGIIKEHNYYDREVKEIKETLSFKPLIKFTSKTIGTGGIDGNISVRSEENRLIIARFNYEEVFEPDDLIEDDVVNNLSKLVYCDGDIQWWISEERSALELKAGIIENDTSYRYSLKRLLDGEEIYPDFFFIENPFSDYKILGQNDPFWKKLIEYSNKCLGCQFLIQNKDDNYKNNYLKDKENRLVFFYGDMYWLDVQKRPGWHLFLNGIFTGNYSLSVDNVLYDSPVSELNLYKDPLNEFRKYKCNYLVNNGQKYYHETYFDGDDYTSTSLMRFALGKIARELEKRKWDYLGQKNIGIMRRSINSIVVGVARDFSIIYTAAITDFDLDLQNNKLTVSIDTTISDLIKSTMSLDITINYNKY